MPRDYKHPPRKRRASRPRSPRRWPWLFGGLAGGFLAGYAVYFFTTHASGAATPAPAPKPATSAPKAAAPARPAEEADAGETTRFDFYRMLPEMEVKIPKDALDTPRSGTQKAGRDGLYILQIGSFRSLAEADRLKAQLAFLGVESSIQSVIISNDSTWYRVQVGPYKNLKDLQQARTTLQRNNIDFMLLRLET